jgi:DNA-binding NarL/FixJ family response regulator
LVLWVEAAFGRSSRRKELVGTIESNTTLKPVRLTKREVEVLVLIANGFSSKEVSERLFVSKRTVDFHLANIYEKLKVSNRVQAFRVAIKLGLIPFEPTMLVPMGIEV